MRTWACTCVLLTALAAGGCDDDVTPTRSLAQLDGGGSAPDGSGDPQPVVPPGDAGPTPINPTASRCEGDGECPSGRCVKSAPDAGAGVCAVDTDAAIDDADAGA